MHLQKKTLEKLRDLINEETEYRSGPKLVQFFNELGFNDTYGQGFPSRWMYTDEKLSIINGTPELDKCIRNLFAPVNFIGRIDELDKFISEFNQYLAFDGWKVIRKGKDITFAKADEKDLEITLSTTKPTTNDVEDFLRQEFEEISLEKIGLSGVVIAVLNLRLEEIKKCLTSTAPLAAIFLCGSTLEGILLGIGLNYPKQFNQAKAAPKNIDNKVRQFHEWTLNDFINVAYELGLLKEDVKKFSHSLRDFRNYIHPFQQVSSGFNPDEHTAKISWQVLKAAIFELAQAKIDI